MKRFFGVAVCLLSLSACALPPRHHREWAPPSSPASLAPLASFAPDIQRAFTYDTNGDRRLDREEWLNAQWAVFAAAHDLDQDGVVTQDEYLRSTCNSTQAGQTNGVHDWCARAFLKSEFGKRPQLDRAAYRRPAEALFKRIDANKDGYVTPEEMAGPVALTSAKAAKAHRP